MSILLAICISLGEKCLLELFPRREILGLLETVS